MSEDSFERLMTRLRDGDEDAAREIFDRYAKRLIGLARSRMDPVVRRKVDPEDVMLSAFRSFFIRNAQGQYDLGGWDNLWALLTVITLRKCGHKAVRFRAACRDAYRESAPPAGDDSSAGWEAVAREPTPAEAAMLTETVEQVLSGLDVRDRPVIELALQGYTAPEISERIGRSERTIYRLLARVKTRLERECASDADG